MSRNLADKDQVKRAERQEKDLRKQELDDMKTVLSNASGKRLLWRLMGTCNTFSTIYSESSSRMSYLSGKQDVGHFLMSEIIAADPNLFVKLMKDNNKAEGKL